MNDKLGDIIVRALIQDFRDYQIQWLTSHNDIELERELEELIIGFLNDTSSYYITEHTE